MAEQIRDGFYRDPQIRRLLAFLMTHNEELTPERAPDSDYFYPQAEDLLEKNRAGVARILEKLVEAKILDRETVRRQTICPACKAPQILARLDCPFCMTNNLQKVEVVVHGCGYSGQAETFRSGDRVICPKCGLELDEEEFREPQNVFNCASCFRIVVKPSLMLECDSCGKISRYDSVDLRPVYAYKISPAVRNEILEECSIDVAIARQLTEKGFTVTAPAVVRGNISNFSIDVLAKNLSKTLAIHILNLGRPAGVDNISEIKAVAREIRPDKSIIIAMPGLTKEARKLAELFRLTVVESDDTKDILARIDRES